MKLAALYIAPDGTVSAIADETAQDIAAKLGDPVKARASHVLPANPIKRFTFRVIRSVVGERGKVADWCRSWRGPWQVRFASNPRMVSFQHASRRVCIRWEINQLERRFAAQ